MDRLKATDEEMIVVAPRSGLFLFRRDCETVGVYLRKWEPTLIRANLHPISKRVLVSRAGRGQLPRRSKLIPKRR